MSLLVSRGLAPCALRRSSARRKEAGFTLIEVVLAIVVGALLVAGALLIYQQAKRSAGDSRAKVKVEALRAMIEETSQLSGGAYPSLAQVQSAWKIRRPEDYGQSPWGGTITGFVDGGNNGIKGNDAVAGGTFLGTGEPGDGQSGADPTDTGMVYYYRVSDKNPLYMLDVTLQNTVQVRDYGVGVTTSDGRRYHHVNGNLRKTGLEKVEGQVGN